MLVSLHNPAAGRMRIILFASGSGRALDLIYQLQQEMEGAPDGCPFEVAGVFSDQHDSAAQARARNMGLPTASLSGPQAQNNRAVLDLIRPWRGDVIVLDGGDQIPGADILAEYPVLVGREAPAADASGSRPAVCLAGTETVLLLAPSAGREQFQEQLAQALTRAGLEMALGHLSFDAEGRLHHRGKHAPSGLVIDDWQHNRPRHQRPTAKLLRPSSVAVIGASNKPGIGRAIVANILRDKFQGPVYAVNVRSEDVMEAKGYASVLDIPGTLDLAVIAAPAPAVLAVAEECGRKGVGAIICVTAGFKEIGGEGAAAQEQLMAIVDRYNMRLIGPNCMGAMSLEADLNATIIGAGVPGHVALVTQSGSIGASMLDYARDLGLGFSSMVSLGNQADVTVCDLLPFYERDEHTRVIVLYLEMVLEPQRFCRLVSQMTKPVLVLKSGRTAAGMAAVSSHTGSLAGDDQLVDAMLDKAGVTRVDTVEELFFCAEALSMMPRTAGKRVGLLTNAGGPGILISDALAARGFTIPPLSEAVKAKLTGRLFKEASIANPIDVVATAPPEHFVLAAEAMLESGDFDALIICCVPPATVDTVAIAQALAPILKGVGLPVLAAFWGPSLCGEASRILRANGIPASEYPEQTATMLHHLRQTRRGQAEAAPGPDGRTRRQARAILAQVKPGQYLQTEQAYGLLNLFGIRAARNLLVKTADEAQSVDLDFPVVAKIEHPEILHKSDVGGVRLNIADQNELREVVDSFLRKFSGAGGVLVQEQVPAGLELIVGSVSDPQLGSGLMVGLGGVWVEILKDVVFGYPPLGRSAALELIDRLKCAPLINGYRGQPGVNKEELAGLIERVSAMLLALPEIVELDLNPIIYDRARDAFIAADVRIKKG